MDHGFKHLRCGNHALAEQSASLGELLLDCREIDIRNFHTEVTSRDHDTVRDRADLIDMIHTRLILDLCDDIDIPAAILRQKVPKLTHIASVGHKRRGNEVNSVLDTKQQIRFILLTQIISL